MAGGGERTCMPLSARWKPTGERELVQGDPVPDRHRPISATTSARKFSPCCPDTRRRLHAGGRHQQPARRRRRRPRSRAAVPHSELARNRHGGDWRPRHSMFVTGRSGPDGKPIAGAMLDLGWQTRRRGRFTRGTAPTADACCGIYHTNADGSRSAGCALLGRADQLQRHSDGRANESATSSRTPT